MRFPNIDQCFISCSFREYLRNSAIYLPTTGRGWHPLGSITGLEFCQCHLSDRVCPLCSVLRCSDSDINFKPDHGEREAHQEEEDQDANVGEEEGGNACGDERGHRPGGLRVQRHAQPPLTGRQAGEQQCIRHTHPSRHFVLLCIRSQKNWGGGVNTLALLLNS